MSRRADKNKNLAISEKQIKRIETAAKQQQEKRVQIYKYIIQIIITITSERTLS